MWTPSCVHGCSPQYLQIQMNIEVRKVADWVPSQGWNSWSGALKLDATNMSCCLSRRSVLTKITDAMCFFVFCCAVFIFFIVFELLVVFFLGGGGKFPLNWAVIDFCFGGMIGTVERVPFLFDSNQHLFISSPQILWKRANKIRKHTRTCITCEVLG